MYRFKIVVEVTEMRRRTSVVHFNARRGVSLDQLLTSLLHHDDVVFAQYVERWRGVRVPEDDVGDGIPNSESRD